MRVYHFLKSKHAKSTLQHLKLKASSIGELNDPFEFAPFEMPTELLEEEQRRERKEMAKKFLLLCFSKSYADPAMWAYYADSHRGVCLGFDVPEASLIPVNYVPNRLPFPHFKTITHDEWLQTIVMPFVSTKAISWVHESEVRMLVTHSDCELIDDLWHYPFNINLRLREIILGHRFNDELPRFDSGSNPSIQPVQAVLSKSKFEIELQSIN